MMLYDQFKNSMAFLNNKSAFICAGQHLYVKTPAAQSSFAQGSFARGSYSESPSAYISSATNWSTSRSLAVLSLVSSLVLPGLLNAQSRTPQLIPAAVVDRVVPAVPVSPYEHATGGIGGTGSVDSARFSVGKNPSGPSYTFSPEDFKSLRYSRADKLVRLGSEQQTKLQFSLRPGKLNFSLAGGFGLIGVFSNPEFEMQSSTAYWRRLDERLPELHDGLSYSAGVKIEHETAQISDTAYVSSGQLGLSYGRLGRVWYNGVDLSLHQTTTPEGVVGEQNGERVSLDVTTGRKVSWTGVGTYDPLWLLSLRGDFDVQDEANSAASLGSSDGDWYLNPSLFWEKPGFRFSAQLEVPIDEDLLRDSEEPDYRLRAIIEKSFR